MRYVGILTMMNFNAISPIYFTSVRSTDANRTLRLNFS